MRTKKILVPLDFGDCAKAALDHGLFLASRYGAELHLLHVITLFADDSLVTEEVFPGMEDIYERLEKAASQAISEAVEERSKVVCRIREAVQRGIAAAPEILYYAKEHDIDLVVIGTHGRRGLRRAILGSVAEEVVREAHCPVITIRDPASARRLAQLQRVVVPHDFSPESTFALRTAVDLVDADGALIDLIHVIPALPTGVAGVPVPTPYYGDVAQEISDAMAREAAASMRAGVSVVPHVLHGHPPVQIVDFAERYEADLVVIGSHGLTGVQRFLMGSVSERVVRTASCPVLVARRPPGSSPVTTEESAAE